MRRAPKKDGKYMTTAFARITCAKCGKIVDELLPGENNTFDSIKECECQKKPEPKRIVKVKKETSE